MLFRMPGELHYSLPVWATIPDLSKLLQADLPLSQICAHAAGCHLIPPPDITCLHEA